MNPRVLNLTENLNQDGGEWEFFRNIVEKYGLVPDYAMPETDSSGNSDSFTQYLEPRIREIGGILHRMAKQGASEQALKTIKQKGLKEVYRILVKALGVPPKSFYWKDQSGKVKQLTPLAFARENPLNLRQLVHVGHLPYLPLGEQVRVADIGNMVEGDGLSLLNLEMSEIKTAIRASIKAGHPVIFTAETAHRQPQPKEVSDKPTKQFWATDTDDSAFFLDIDPNLRLNKGDRLKYRVTSLAHLMLLVGCDDASDQIHPLETSSKIPEVFGPLWRAENSWQNQEELYLSDAWLDEYLYAMVIDPSFLSAASQEKLADPFNPVNVVQGWDPLGRV